MARIRAVYYQVAEELKEKIMTGGLAPGEMILSESQLAELYGISRTTVRQGIGLLVDAGYLYSVPGKGYFVAAPALNKIIENVTEAPFIGQNPSVLMSKVDVMAADELLVEKLRVRPGESTLRMQLIINSSDGPVGIDNRHIPYRRGQPLLEKELQYADFPDAVARHSKLVVAKSDLTVAAIPLNKHEAELLAVEAGFPALCVEQVLYDVGDKPLGWSITKYRSDRYVFAGITHAYSGKV